MECKNASTVLMKMKKYWDEKAKKEAKIIKNEIGIITNYLIQHTWLKLIKKSTHYIIPTNKEIKVLKTDLWNEGVRKERKILGRKLETDPKSKFDIYGIDISSVVCNLAKRMLEAQTEIICTDLRNTSFKEGVFNFIFDLSTIDHFPPEQISQVINEYHRVLKSQGILLLLSNSSLSIPWRIHHTIFKDRIDFWYHNPMRLRNLFIKCKFQPLEEYFTHSWNISPRILVLAEKLLGIESIFRLISKFELTTWSRFFSLFARQYAIIAKKL